MVCMFSSEGPLKIVTAMGGMCEDDAECVVPLTACRNGICECEEGFIHSADNSQCYGNRFVLPVNLLYAITELNLHTRILSYVWFQA
jgi:hypothetical protein